MLKFYILATICFVGVYSQEEEREKCFFEADIVLCLDRSGSVGNANYQQFMKGFAEFLATHLQLKDSGADFRLGVVAYEHSADRVIELLPSCGFGLTCFLSLINPPSNVLGESTNGGTNAADALLQAADMLSNGPGSRSGVKKIVIYLNDGEPNNQNNEIPAQMLRLENMGADIFSFGITDSVEPGTDGDDYNRLIASKPLTSFYKWIPTFAMLNNASFLDDFIERFCRETVKLTASKCIGRKTPIGIINQESLDLNGLGLINPQFNQLNGDSPFVVDPNTGEVSTSAVGSLAKLKIDTEIKFEVEITSGEIKVTVLVCVTIIQDNCGPATYLQCERSPTLVTKDICENQNPGNLPMIQHPTYPYLFIFCNNNPPGICQRCAGINLVFSNICQHCVNPNDPMPCVTTTPTVPPPPFCKLNLCPRIDSCTPSLHDHPAAPFAFCQCQPGHPHGGCHLCPIGLPFFNSAKQCCQVNNPGGE